MPPITHPMGELGVSATYLLHPNFQLDTKESLLSSRFLSEGPDFTPTLVKNQQRDSISGSPGSLALRTSLPRSPPRSVAERFVIPPPTHTRTTSFSSTQGIRGSPSGSPRLGNIALPVTRNLSGAGMGTSGVSDSSSSRQGAASLGSREDVSALAARVRRESLHGRSSVRDIIVRVYAITDAPIAGWRDRRRCTDPPHANHDGERVQVVYNLIWFTFSSFTVTIPTAAVSAFNGRPVTPVASSPVTHGIPRAPFAHRCWE